MGFTFGSLRIPPLRKKNKNWHFKELIPFLALFFSFVSLVKARLYFTAFSAKKIIWLSEQLHVQFCVMSVTSLSSSHVHSTEFNSLYVTKLMHNYWSVSTHRFWLFLSLTKQNSYHWSSTFQNELWRRRHFCWRFCRWWKWSTRNSFAAWISWPLKCVQLLLLQCEHFSKFEAKNGR